MKNKPVMNCGHVANAVTSNGKPCCVICNTKEAFEVSKEKLDLTNRLAKCTDCSKIVKSDLNLPFFEYKKDKTEDSFYCGCQGWD